jgi:hypothetical protein
MLKETTLMVIMASMPKVGFWPNESTRPENHGGLIVHIVSTQLKYIHFGMIEAQKYHIDVRYMVTATTSSRLTCPSLGPFPTVLGGWWWFSLWGFNPLIAASVLVAWLMVLQFETSVLECGFLSETTCLPSGVSSISGH